MNTGPALSLLEGRTVHVRHTPFEQRFSYRLFMIDIDIDRLHDAGRSSALFSINRPSLYGFSAKDHGDGSGDLRGWADGRFAEAGVDLKGGTVRLVTFPRHLFYKFAPLSIWLGHDANGRLAGVLYEVRNTFGERHTYIAPMASPKTKMQAEKAFHVSPFFDVSGRYRFTLHASETRFDLVVETLHGRRRSHMANIKTRRRAATSGRLLRAALLRPASSLGVTFAIHWEALKLWIRGAGYRARPSAPATEHTLARPAECPAGRVEGG